MSLPNLVPRGDLTGSIGTSSKRWATGSFGRLEGNGEGLTGVTAEWDGSHVGNASITGSLTLSGSYGTAEAVVQAINFDQNYSTSGTSDHVTGRLRWDGANGALTVDMLGSSASLQIGQEQYIYARNNSGVDISDGQVVRITGATVGFTWLEDI